MSEALNFISSAFYAFLGGLIPSLIWLYFWHRENQKNPQSKSTVLLAFFGGIVAVSISLVLEKFAFSMEQYAFLFKLFKPLLEWLKMFH
jgi:RsiW-degrading membrane proteinase PrsW (M82 family)